MALPGKPVSVGDTWSMVHRWTSLKNGIPLEVDIVSILKNVYDCGEKVRCADIEISGDVRIPMPVSQGVSLESRVMGRLLFGVESGTVIWADIRNQEVTSVLPQLRLVLAWMISFPPNLSLVLPKLNSFP